MNDPAWCGDVWSQIGHVYELKREVCYRKKRHLVAVKSLVNILSFCDDDEVSHGRYLRGFSDDG